LPLWLRPEAQEGLPRGNGARFSWYLVSPTDSFILARGNALGTIWDGKGRLKACFKRCLSGRLKQAFSLQSVACTESQGVALG
jgi:hypothetical protein